MVEAHEYPSPKELSFRRSDVDRRNIIENIDISELDMPKRGKSAYTDKQKRHAGAVDSDPAQKDVARPEARARAWVTANKRYEGNKKNDPRHKVPFGPVGGSGRKTNLARSS